jgi:hypothetical protein
MKTYIDALGTERNLTMNFGKEEIGAYPHGYMLVNY